MQVSPGDPRVAVVMITHNRVDEVLRSLGELTRLPERPRIVVVDNGSNDGTAQAVAGRFPGVELVDAGGNLGAAARTIGVRHVAAPYVAFCDDDTWWEPGSLRRAADRARLTLELNEHGHLALAPRAPGADGAIGRILGIVYDAMAEGSWHRLKACRQCAWAYYDYSKNRSATWCSMAICGNRTKTRAYRRRRSKAS